MDARRLGSEASSPSQRDNKCHGHHAAPHGTVIQTAVAVVNVWHPYEPTRPPAGDDRDATPEA
jgi:hypothetical protein